MSTTISDRIKELIKTKANGKNTVFAERLGVAEANIRSYTKGVMPKADILEKIVITYDINAMWLLTGVGEMFVSEEQETQNNSSAESIVDKLLGIIDKKEDIIRQQAEDVGQLRAELAQLKLRLQKSADAASTERTANVG